jgi:hypothetical protein
MFFFFFFMNVSATITAMIVARAAGITYGSADRDAELCRSNQRNVIQTQQASMPADNQKGKAPPPGPSSGIQPMGSSALFTIK